MNKMKRLFTINDLWKLKLADRLSWSLSASPSTKNWLRKLASIIELKPGSSDGPKVHFAVRSDFGDSSRLPNHHLPGFEKSIPFLSNWTSQKFGFLRWWSSPGETDTICELPDVADMENDIMMMSEALLPLYRQTIAAGGIPIHAALIECTGRGFIIAASGGVGKSTCCRRLPPPWNPLCDDETLIVPGRSKLFFAHPFPTWSEYLSGQSNHTWNVESRIPLYALFLLSQGTTDKVVPLSQIEASIRINQSAIQVCNRIWYYMSSLAQREIRIELFGNACKLAKAVPCFELRTGVTGRFWDLVDRVLPRVKAAGI